MTMPKLNAPVLRPVNVAGGTAANDEEAGDVTRLRPTLDAASDFNVLVDRSIRLLAQDACVYQKGGELVIVANDDVARPTRIRKAKPSQLRYLLAKHATWTKDDEPCHPPASVATCIVDRGAWEHVRPLRAVTSFPALSSSGALRMAPGYDADTAVLVAGDVALQVPEEPSRDDARRAVATLLDVVQDFPFADNAHRSAWLAALLTPLTRFAHDGNVPLVLVQANAPRVGKTRLVQVISYILTGAESPAITQTRG